MKTVKAYIEIEVEVEGEFGVEPPDETTHGHAPYCEISNVFLRVRAPQGRPVYKVSNECITHLLTPEQLCDIRGQILKDLENGEELAEV